MSPSWEKGVTDGWTNGRSDRAEFIGPSSRAQIPTTVRQNKAFTIF